MLLVCRYRVAAGEVGGFTARARRAIELLTAQPGCRQATLARATEDGQTWLLVAEFESVNAYRRALSPFDVREHVVPLLSEPDRSGTGGPSTFESLLIGADGVVTERPSVIAADAGEVGVGGAAGPAQPR
jgi:quinol monooxygenase YgiN